MKGWNWLRELWRDVVPGPSRLFVSVFMHVLALAASLGFLYLLRRTRPTHVVSTQYQVTRINPERPHIYSGSNATPSHAPAAHAVRRVARLRLEQTVFLKSGEASEELRAEAQKQTAAITDSLKYKWIYGFYPGADYKLAFQTSGEIPVITADQLPLHYQQYVVVEVTIDTGGQVAEARVVSGLVDPLIQQKLLSAIREFKYSPATRDGVPIPSQKDIVIHVPS